MPHILETFNTFGLGNVVENEQKVPISEREEQEIIEINIFRGGEQTSQSGSTRVFTSDELQDVCETYDPEMHLAPLIRGHDEKDDGAPSSGWVKEIFRKGLNLFAKVGLTGFGRQILSEGDYRRVSCRFYAPEDPANPTPGKLSLRHLALVTIPAVKGLEIFSEGASKNPFELNNSEWDYIYSEPLNMEFSNSLNEQEEVSRKLKQKIKSLILDSEQKEPLEEDKGANIEQNRDIDSMDLSERATPVDFIPLDSEIGNITYEEDEEMKKPAAKVSIEISKYDDDSAFDAEDGDMDFYNLDGEDECFSDKAEVSSEPYKYSNQERLTNPRKKEYEQIIKEEKEEDDADILQGEGNEEKSKKNLLANLLKSYSNQRAVEKSPAEPITGESSIDSKKEYNYGEEDEELSTDSFDLDDTDDTKNSKSKKKLKIVVPEPRPAHPKPFRLEEQSYSESALAELSAAEQKVQKRIWEDFAEAYYNQGILTEAVIKSSELVDTLMFLDNQTANLTFSEGQVNPVDTVKKLLNIIPPLVGLNGYEPNPQINNTEMFREPLSSLPGLAYAENDPESPSYGFDPESFAIHQKALAYSEKNNVDYYTAVQKVLN